METGTPAVIEQAALLFLCRDGIDFAHAIVPFQAVVDEVPIPDSDSRDDLGQLQSLGDLPRGIFQRLALGDIPQTRQQELAALGGVGGQQDFGEEFRAIGPPMQPFKSAAALGHDPIDLERGGIGHVPTIGLQGGRELPEIVFQQVLLVIQAEQVQRPTIGVHIDAFGGQQHDGVMRPLEQGSKALFAGRDGCHVVLQFPGQRLDAGLALQFAHHLAGDHQDDQPQQQAGSHRDAHRHLGRVHALDHGRLPRVALTHEMRGAHRGVVHAGYGQTHDRRARWQSPAFAERQVAGQPVSHP